jgi:hypothetical protein
LVFPARIELPGPVTDVVERLEQAGGRVLADSDPTSLSAALLGEKLRHDYRFVPPSDRIALGRFFRNDRTVLLIVNVGNRPYEGRLAVSEAANWERLDPTTGTMETIVTVPDDGLPISLHARQAFLLVSGR